jgi:hypothetical protein
LELLQGEVRLMVRDIGVAKKGQCRRIGRHFVDQWFEVFDRP